MKVVIRADASLAIGSGHVMRCRTLAQALRERGHDVLFVCRPFAGNLVALLRSSGFEVRGLDAAARLDGLAHRLAPADAAEDARQTAAAAEGGADWLVVDHYGLDAGWVAPLRPVFRRILAIDDGADARPLDCDLLLNQNLGSSAASYAGRVPAAARLLLGPQWALVRAEFAALRQASLARRAQPACGRLLVCLGGGDVAPAVLEALAGAQASGIAWQHVDVVLGGAAPGLERIEAALAGFSSARLHVQTEDMAALMAAADFAVAAGGGISWEKCCLGLPSLVVVLSANQRAIAAALAAADAVIAVEPAADAYAAALRSLQPERMGGMAAAAAALCDGGGAARLARLLEEGVE